MPEDTANKEVEKSAVPLGRWMIIIFCVALVLRLLHLWGIQDEAFASLLLGDGQRYDEWARGIAAGNWIGTDVFYQAPLYPYFLGIVYSIFGDSILSARVVQVVLGAASCVLLADAGRRFFSRPVGLVAGFGLAVYAPAIFFDGLIQKSILDGFFMGLTLWLMGRLHERPQRTGHWFALGLVLGGLILTRENAMLFLPAVLLWLGWRFRPEGRGRLVMAGALLLGVALVLGPVAVRNKVVGGEFLITTSQFGPNFYIGNNAQADGTYHALRPGRGSPRYERLDAQLLAELDEGRSLSPAQVSRHWTRRALSYMTAQPGDWLKLVATKFALLWHKVELVDTESLESYADASWVLNLTRHVFHFGVLAPLALLGVMLTWSRRRELGGLYALILVYVAGLLLFYIVARYRYPLVPLLMLFAAGGLTGVKGYFTARSGVALTGVVVATMLAAAFCNWPGLVPGFENLEVRMRGVTESNLGTELLRRGEVEAALPHLRLAVEAEPNSVEFLNNLGRGLYYNDQPDEALELYERALALDPDSPLTHNQLGIFNAARNKLDEAMVHYRAALDADPLNETVHLNLANALMEQDQIEAALPHYREAVRLAPDHAEAHNYLGIALLRLGRDEEGVAQVEAALRLKPDYFDAMFNMGVALRNRNRLDEAATYFRRVLEHEPEYFEAHSSLGFIYGSQGRHEAAKEHFIKTLQLRPEFDEGHFNLGVAYNLTGEPKQALSHVREALRLKPDAIDRMVYLAGMLGTNYDAGIRDPEEAIGIAEQAAELTGRQDPAVLDTLAAAYAAAGRFEDALNAVREAIDTAQRAGATAYAEDIRTREALYRAGRPYVAPRP